MMRVANWRRACAISVAMVVVASGVSGCVSRETSALERGAVPVDGVELAALISDRTMSGFLVTSGEPWIAYASPDGSAVTRSNGESFEGVWWVTGPQVCFRYQALFPKQGRCFEVRRRADAALFYFVGFNGPELYRIATDIVEGDPQGLVEALQPAT